ncbi:MAG: lysophospholipid acyltransferase family protein [Angelakisella sp.]
MTAFYWLALNATHLLALLLYRIRYVGKENLPREGGYIVACNHRSLLDPVLLAHGIPRQVNYMGKVELFHVPVLGPILRGVGVFPVERGTGDASALDHAVELLQQGNLMGIFPEGTRSHDGQMGRPKSGMAHLAKTAQVGVVPCAIRFEGKMKLWKRIEISYGKPIPYETLFGEDTGGAALKRATKLVMGQIADLLGTPQGLAAPHGTPSQE